MHYFPCELAMTDNRHSVLHNMVPHGRPTEFVKPVVFEDVNLF